MPKKIDKYRILVASPNDVRDERESIKEVIDELNNTYGVRENVVIELVRWETHSAPAISNTSIQDIIDKDLGDDYDLFVGILWKKFGTPTKKFDSGTEQEFRNAYSRFVANPSTVQILFYFKTLPPLSLSDIEPNELRKVNEFKQILGEKSVLYWEYNTIEDLQKFLRIHITKRLDELIKNYQSQILAPQSNNEVKFESTTEEELGVIDYQEIIEESFGDSTSALLRITEATNWIGKEIKKKTSEISSLSSSKQMIGKKTLRDFFSRTASILNDYASRIEPDIPIFIRNFEKGTDAISNLVMIYRTDFGESKQNDIDNVKNSIEALKKEIGISLMKVKYFLDSVNNLPRMAKELNQARRNVEIKLKELLNKTEVAHSIVTELQKNLNKN